MSKTFPVKLADLQPSQLYVCAEKLARVVGPGPRTGPGEIEAVPVKRLGGKLVLTDGHTRAFAALRAGRTEIPAYWDTDELDWEAYRICVDWCSREGIHSVADLADRVVSGRDYETLWYERCRAMHRELDQRRRTDPTKGRAGGPPTGRGR